MNNTTKQRLRKLQELPAINPAAMESLPSFLKDVRQTQKLQPLQDVILLTTLTALASLQSNVYCIHDKKPYRPNLMLFVLAPFASGKAVMTQVKAYFKHVEKKLKESYEAEMRAYKQAIRQYKENQQSGDGQMEEPIKPIRIRVFLASNASSAAMIRNISNNQGRGVILETEAGTVAILFESDWANFKDVLLKNAVNEDIEFSRKQESYTIESPHVSLALSTTPQEDILKSIFADGSDGLISRVMVYYFETPRNWNREVFVTDGWKETSDYSDALSQRVLRMHNNLERFSRVIIQWNESQSEVLNTMFEKMLDESKGSHGDGSAGLIYRLGLNTTRLATVLTVVRLMDQSYDEIPGVHNYSYGDDFIIHPSDEDLTCAMTIIIAIREHVLALFEALQQGENKLLDIRNKNVAKTYELLPESFARKDAIKKVGTELNLQPRAIDKYLSGLIRAGLLEKDNKGNYSKTK